MRILHIYKDYLPVIGGIEKHVQMLAEAQAARGLDVTVLVTSLNRRTHIEMIRGVRVMYASRLFNFSSAPFSVELLRRVAQCEPDITHLHSPYPIGEVANLLFGRAPATVVTYHSDIVRQRMMGAIYMPLLHRVLARVNTIIATSPNYIETSSVLRHWKKKCVVVPLASPLAAAKRMENVRARSEGSELLFVGRLRYYKGLDYLLQAMTLLPNVSLTVVGTGPMENEWKVLAQKLDVARRVQWVGDAREEALAAYYSACDVFVLPCSERSEAFGAVQLEAMAAGKPVVSCDVNTGVAWVNQNEITGLVVPPKNARALADAITRLMSDPAPRARMGEAGRARVMKEFTLEQMVARVMRVYENARHQLTDV